MKKKLVWKLEWLETLIKYEGRCGLLKYLLSGVSFRVNEQ